MLKSSKLASKKRISLYLTEKSDKWLTEQAGQQGLSKNDIIQILINREMEEGDNAARGRN